jgi:hypothetical protein
VHAADTPAVSDDGKVENGILLFAVKVMAWSFLWSVAAFSSSDGAGDQTEEVDVREALAESRTTWWETKIRGKWWSKKRWLRPNRGAGNLRLRRNRRNGGGNGELWWQKSAAWGRRFGSGSGKMKTDWTCLNRHRRRVEWDLKTAGIKATYCDGFRTRSRRIWFISSGGLSWLICIRHITCSQEESKGKQNGWVSCDFGLLRLPWSFLNKRNNNFYLAFRSFI